MNKVPPAHPSFPRGKDPWREPPGCVTARLPRTFYARSTLRVARDLLGKLLVHEERCGRIVEVEAYIGADDRASHARVGRKGRAAIMYGPAGFAYVFQVYGMHFCFNVVTERDDFPGAVLVRAIEPADPTERGSGPALVCRALRITRVCDGMDLVTSNLLIADAPEVADTDVRVGPRVGVDYAGEWAGRPWRFWVANSQHVSRPRVTGTTLDPAMLG
ncbi:MAG: DNA-3-methyladenine glycosylase [Chloroflexi bacterium]|nr:DNA-3-methyladenine glycosylase [Chloroflexota bacterium]